MQRKPRTETAEITGYSLKVKYGHKHKMKQTKEGFVHRKISHIGVTRKHLIVSFPLILLPERNHRTKMNI